jgi:CspA family cold shock protein
MSGTIRKFDDDTGFGFIQGTDGRDYFFHRSAVALQDLAEIEIGAPVRFAPMEGARGPRTDTVELA